MNTINEEDKKAEILKEFEQYCNECDYFNHRIWAYEKMKSLMDKAFAYSDAEIERLRKENDSLGFHNNKKTIELAALKKQVEDLANFIMNNIPQEPSKNEGAIECAIRIIQTQKKKLDWIHVNDKLPEPGQRVIIEGGMGFHQNGSWYTIVDEGNKNPLPVQWQVLYWKYLPSLT